MDQVQLERRLQVLLNEKSVKRGTFVLASGKRSDFYVDVRQTSLHAEGSWLIGQLVLRRLHPDVVAVGGLTLGADPIACATSALSATTPRPVHAFLIRKAAKDHGTHSRIEGAANVRPGDAVTIVEDTTTTGGSLLQAVEVAREAGLRVLQCITVVDRQEGAAERLEAQGLTLEALTTRDQLLGASP